MERSERISIRGLTLAAVVVALPLVRGMTLYEEPGVSFGIFRLTTLHYFDLFLVVAVGAALIEHRHLGWSRSRVGLLAAAIPMALAASVIFNPSPRGVSMALRWLAGGLLFASMSTMDRDSLRRHVAWPMLAMATAQGALAWVQLVTDSSAGFDVVGGAAPRIVNGVARTAGTFAVPYLLAAYALVALGVGFVLRPRRTSPVWLMLMAGAAVPVAITFSRAALLGVVVGGGLALIAARTDATLRSVVLAVAAGLLVPALIHLGSWTDRIEDSTLEELSPDGNVRYELVEQASTLLGDHWLIGVGAGRYSLALEERFDLDERSAHPVHVAPLLFVVEVGLILGLAVVALAALALFESARSSAGVRVLLALPMGLVLFDHLNVTHPIGPVLTMVWLAVVASAVDRHTTAEAVATEPALC